MRVYQGDPGKLAGTSPPFSDELLRFVERAYGLDVSNPEKLGGSWNLNVRLDGHVVRVYGPWVTEERLLEIQRIRHILAQRGIPTSALRPMLDGAMYAQFGDCMAEVEAHVAGTPMQTWSQLQVGMRKFAQLHACMADLEIGVPPPVANHLPQELAVAATQDVLQVIEAWGPTAQEERYAAAIAELVQMLPVMDLPVQLVHGDFKDNNLVFRANELMAVLDLDFMGIRPRIDDLALPLHTMLQHNKTLTQVQALVDIYDASCLVPLSAQERRALPYAMARQSLCYLQYMMIPGDAAYAAHCRREFNESRGPACEWWLYRLQDAKFREGGFV